MVRPALSGAGLFFCRFEGEEGAFTGGSPTVTLNDAGFADNPMAGNEPGDGIRAASGTDGTDGFVISDRPGDPPIAGDATFRYAEKRAPDFQLKWRGADEGF